MKYVVVSNIFYLHPYLSFAFFCCHLRYAEFGHINQKLSPYCSRRSSRKQYSHFLCGSFAEVRFAGICHCVFYISYEQHIKISYIDIYCALYDVIVLHEPW